MGIGCISMLQLWTKQETNRDVNQTCTNFQFEFFTHEKKTNNRKAIVCDDWRRMLDDINSNRLRLSTFPLSHSPNYTYTRTQYEEREFKSIKLMNWIRCVSSFAIDWIHNSSFNHHHHGICPIPFTWAPHDHRTSNELNLFLLDGNARYMCGVRLTSRWTDFFNHLIHWHSFVAIDTQHTLATATQISIINH